MVIITANNHKTMAIINSSDTDGATALGGLAEYKQLPPPAGVGEGIYILLISQMKTEPQGNEITHLRRELIKWQSQNSNPGLSEQTQP